MTTRLINTDAFAGEMRRRIIKTDERRILVSRLEGSDQEDDLTVPPNCSGLGRVRHFRRATAANWPTNPLPIDPASCALGGTPGDVLRAQVFQNAACAWRCWYCYVPYNLLSGDQNRSAWVSAEDLVALYLREEDRPTTIDLSGGSPDLTPEWVVWMMDALTGAGLRDGTYLWSDDNLSTDYVFSKLSDEDRRTLASYKNYGRVCCFKGFDAASFQFNTGADGSAYDSQFEIFRRYLELGLDLYGYATLTGEESTSVASAVPAFFDRLQRISEALPLRVIPLRIESFIPNTLRQERRHWSSQMTDVVQDQAIAAWNEELAKRFSNSDRALPIHHVEMKVRS